MKAVIIISLEEDKLNTYLKRRVFIGLISSVGFMHKALAAGHPTIEKNLSDALLIESIEARRKAIEGSLHRLHTTILPSTGKFIVVNVANCILTAYEDGTPVFQMKVACGMPKNPTPLMSDNVGAVIFNPIWTMPSSISAEREWKENLQDLAFRKKYGFSFHNGRYVQKPGSLNLLGTQKISLASGGTIYLHDTNEPKVFHNEHRLVTHGCVRLESPFVISAWMLGIGEKEALEIYKRGYSSPIKPPMPIIVTLAYFTAWPDASGKIIFSSDSYGLDRHKFI